jgi:predicted DNA-binding transcriptional regulator AlpA
MPRRADITARLPFVLGLDRLEAAAMIGVSSGTFDVLVRDGRMPRPRTVGSRRIWDVDELRAAFKSLPRDGETAEDETWADVG